MWKRILARLVMLTLAVGWAAGVQAAETVRIGWTAWSDAEFVTKVAKRVLEQRMGQEVELIQTAIAPQYQGVATGDIDVMLMSWLPDSQSDYMDKVGRQVANLGVLYDHAKLGWVVPDYIPEDQLSSIEDLKNTEVRDRLDSRITGIDPGAGIMRLSKQTMDAYGLDDYTLQGSSGAGMTAALSRAIKRKEWIVVTGWSPHWKFGKWDLRYLNDPKQGLGAYQRVHAIARKGFYQENIDAATMLARMWIPLDELQAAMFDARETSYDEAVTKYIQEHEKRIHYWVTGEIQ